MSDALTLALLLGVPLVWFAVKFWQRQAEEERRRRREAERSETRRVQECDDILLAFLNDLGYLAREAISRQELQSLIDSGTDAETLIETIWQRCEAVPGVVIGHRSFGSAELPVKLLDTLRERHLYVIGRSGSGKTTLLRNLILQDLVNGYGLAVLAPEQELLTEELLPFIPAFRMPDVVYINPADTDRPVAFNPLYLAAGEDLELKVDQTFTIFRRLFGEAPTPRMDTILRQGLYALIQLPNTTLLDFERLLDRDDDTYRLSVSARLPDERLRRFWRDTYPSYPKDAHLPLLSRLNQLLQPRVIRSLLCAPGPSLNLRQAMDAGRILLFNLSDGILGEANAHLLGQLVVANLQLSALSRADIPPEARRPFLVYIDEFQTFCGVVGTSYEKLLSRARKYRLGLVLAHQQTGQLPESLLKEVFGNVSTMIAFTPSASDAARLARNFVGERNGTTFTPNPNEFLALRVGQAIARINQTVLLMQTLPPPAGPNYELRNRIMAESRARYGLAQLAAPQSTLLGTAPLDGLDPDDVF